MIILYLPQQDKIWPQSKMCQTYKPIKILKSQTIIFFFAISGFLVGEGARDWAVRHGVPSVSSESLISDKANKLYRHYKKKLDAFRYLLSLYQTLKL